MNFSDFYSTILPELPECPEGVVDTHLRLAIVDFCSRTKVWTHTVNDVAVTSGKSTYSPGTEFTLPNGSALDSVSQVWYAGENLKFIPLAQMRRYPTHWPSETGPVVAYTQLNDTSITLYKTPTATQATALDLLVTLKPSLKTLEIPDWLGEKYYEVFSAGAKARLMALAGTTWENPKGAAMYASLFDGDSFKAASIKALGRSGNQLSSPSNEAQA